MISRHIVQAAGIGLCAAAASMGTGPAHASGWTQVFHTPTHEIVEVFSSPDDQVAWFITNFDRIWKTDDGGQTWNSITTGAFIPQGLFAVSSSTAFKTSFNNVWRTTNGGASWASVFQHAGNGPPVVWMNGATTGFLCFDGQLYRTTDGGSSWNQAGIAQPPSPIAGTGGKGNICMAGNHLWVVLASGGVAVSHDGAQTWTRPLNLGLPTGGHISRLSFADSFFGLAIAGDIYVTTDGGDHWSFSDNSLGFNEDVLAAGVLGWYIPNPADHFDIRYSTDHGASWTQQLFDGDGFFVLERARGGSALWAGTGIGEIYRYTDPASDVESRITLATANGLRVKPNPCGGSLELAGPASGSASRYRILTVGGRAVIVGRIHDRTVDTASLPPGVYVIEVSDDRGNAKHAAHLVKR